MVSVPSTSLAWLSILFNRLSWRSPENFVSIHVSRISTTSDSLVFRLPKQSILALLCARDRRVDSVFTQSAARTPGNLLAVILTPIPDLHTIMPWSTRPCDTSAATAAA